jgi:hypothetical protein
MHVIITSLENIMLSFDMSGNLGIGTPNFKKYLIRMTPDSKYSVEPAFVERMRITASGTIMFGAEPSRYIFDTEDMASLFKKYLYKIENNHE